MTPDYDIPAFCLESLIQLLRAFGRGLMTTGAGGYIPVGAQNITIDLFRNDGKS